MNRQPMIEQTNWLLDWENCCTTAVFPVCKGEGAVKAAAPLSNPDDADRCPECRGLGYIQTAGKGKRRNGGE